VGVRQVALVHVTLVAGPPCAGKTTYIREHAEPGDLVLAYDDFAGVLTFGDEADRPAAHPLVLAAFYAVLRESRRIVSSRRLWVEQCAPRLEQRERYRRLNGAEVVVLETPAGECCRRAAERFGAASPRAADYVDEIREWWATYEAELDELELRRERRRARVGRAVGD
jgi:predicted kinase